MKYDLEQNPILFSQSMNGHESIGMDLRDWFAETLAPPNG